MLMLMLMLLLLLLLLVVVVVVVSGTYKQQTTFSNIRKFQIKRSGNERRKFLEDPLYLNIMG